MVVLKANLVATLVATLVDTLVATLVAEEKGQVAVWSMRARWMKFFTISAALFLWNLADREEHLCDAWSYITFLV
jgi:hypothetical protein